MGWVPARESSPVWWSSDFLVTCSPLVVDVAVVNGVFFFFRCCGFFDIDVFLGTRADLIHGHWLMDEQGFAESSCAQALEEGCNE